MQNEKPKTRYAYLSRSVTFNNCKCHGWKKKPLGELCFNLGHLVKVLEPKSPIEKKAIKSVSMFSRCNAFVVSLEGKRVVLPREAMFTESEYNEYQKKQKSKLCLLKDKSRCLDES